MTFQHSIEEFSENIRQDVLALAESDEQEMMLSDAFTQTIFDMLSEAGEFDDPLVCYHRTRGIEVSGYLVDEDEARVDLFLSIHTNSSPPETVTRQRIDIAFRRLRSFLEWCLSGRHVGIGGVLSRIRYGCAHSRIQGRPGKGPDLCDHRWQDNR